MSASVVGAGMVPRRLNLELDPNDLRIVGALYFRGVQPAEAMRAALGMSRVTFFLRMKRLRRLGVVDSGMSAVVNDTQAVNLSLAVRQKLFGLETEIRSSGLFDGNLAGDGTMARFGKLTGSSRDLSGAGLTGCESG